MRHGSHILTYLTLLEAHKGGTINIPILKMRTMRHGAVKGHNQDHKPAMGRVTIQSTESSPSLVRTLPHPHCPRKRRQVGSWERTHDRREDRDPNSKGWHKIHLAKKKCKVSVNLFGKKNDSPSL